MHSNSDCRRHRRCVVMFWWRVDACWPLIFDVPRIYGRRRASLQRTQWLLCAGVKAKIQISKQNPDVIWCHWQILESVGEILLSQIKSECLDWSNY